MKYILTLLILSLSFLAYSQTNDTLSQDTVHLITVYESAPQFNGGMEKYREYIDENFNWTQGQLTVEGIVFVEFYIEKDGNISNAKVVKSLCKSCDKEALRLISEMPNWIPGTQRGKPIRGGRWFYLLNSI